MQFIIDFNNATQLEIDDYFQANGCIVVTQYSSFDQVYLVSATVLPPTTAIISSVIDDAQNPVTLLTYPIVSGDTYPKVTFSNTADDDWWKLASFNSPDYTAPTSVYDRRGTSAVVYIVDSGVDKTHTEFEFTDIDELYSLNGDFTDMNGHGTALASIISGKTCGVTTARIKSVKIFQTGVTTLQSHLLAAMDAIISDITANPGKLPIVNLSWSIPKNTFIEDKIRIMIQAGAFVSVAAGNSGQPIDNVTPASMPEVTTVGAFDQALSPCDFSSYTGSVSTSTGFTNYGALDIWAPGEKIRVAISNNQYGAAGGTSLSAAIVSAALAYNSFMSLLVDGTLVPNVSNIVNGTIYGKNNLLTLTGNYAGSVNIISSFLGNKDGENGLVMNSFTSITLLGESDIAFANQIASPVSVNNIVIQDALPVGLTYNNGWIVGKVTTSTPIFWESQIIVNKANGMVQNTIMRISILPSGMTVDDPSIDSQIKITFLAGCGIVFNSGNGTYYCSGTCSSGVCHDVCNFGTPKDSASIQCNCSNLVQCNL